MKKFVVGIVMALMLALAPAPVQAALPPVCSSDTYSRALYWDGPVSLSPITPSHKVARMSAHVGYKICWSGTYKSRWIRLLWLKSRYTKYFPYRNDVGFVWKYQMDDIAGNVVDRTIRFDTDYRSGYRFTDMRKAKRLYFGQDDYGTLRIRPWLRITLKASIPFSPDPSVSKSLRFYVPG